MSRMIRVTADYLDKLRRDFEEIISSGKFADGKISFSRTVGTVSRKVKVFFTEIAWLKMQTLVDTFDKEVAWHGIAVRGKAADEYIIKDILVYPQEVTGASVTTDQTKYEMWLMSQEDEIFNNIRMQGHSHVNMGVTPSSVDNTLYDSILSQLDDNMFYIFMIWNKRGDKTIKIYDLLENVFFDTSDVAVEILDDGTGIEKWLKDSKAMVTSKTYTQPYSYSGGCYVTPQQAVTTASSIKPKAEDEKENKSKKKRKGKRKNTDLEYSG